MAETSEKQEKASPKWISNSFTAAMGGLAGWLTAHWSINFYAKENFEERGLLKDADRKAIQALHCTTDNDILKSIKSAVSGEYGTYYPGAITKIDSVYNDAVKEVFAEHKASSLVGKFKNVLKPEQQWKAVVFVAGAAIAAGALFYSMSKKRTPSEINVTGEDKTQHKAR